MVMVLTYTAANFKVGSTAAKRYVAALATNQQLVVIDCSCLNELLKQGLR